MVYFNCGAYLKTVLAVSMLGGALKKKKMGKLGPIVEKVVLPVETDTEKLTKYLCGGNIYKTGEEIPLKPDSEYPDWLWNLRLGPRPLLEELEPGSREYWKVARKIGIAKNQILLKIKRGKFFFRRPTRPVGLSSLVVQRPMYSRKIVK